MAESPHLLLLLRHASAEAARGGQPDEERSLTAEGRRTLAEIAAGMRALALPVEVILTSPLRRARETAAVVADAYGLGQRLEVMSALAPGGNHDAVLDGLASCRGARGIVLVGHQPDLCVLASTLLVGTPGLVPLPFKKAGLAGISVATLPPRAAGVLEFFLTPVQLCRIGGAG